MDTLTVEIKGSNYLLVLIETYLYALLNEQEEQPTELNVRRENEADKQDEINIEKVLQELDDCF